MKLGVYVFGLATVATGLIDVAWGAFDPAEQPIQAFGDHVPGAHIFAYIVGLALIVAGILVLNRRTARIGAPISMVAYALFAIFYVPRFITAPHYLGQHLSVYLSVLTGVCQNVIVICAAAIVYVWSAGTSFDAFYDRDSLGFRRERHRVRLQSPGIAARQCAVRPRLDAVRTVFLGRVYGRRIRAGRRSHRRSKGGRFGGAIARADVARL